jgi:hypothetical protein
MILRSFSGIFPVYVHSVKVSASVPALLLRWFWEQAGIALSICAHIVQGWVLRIKGGGSGGKKRRKGQKGVPL